MLFTIFATLMVANTGNARILYSNCHIPADGNEGGAQSVQELHSGAFMSVSDPNSYTGYQMVPVTMENFDPQQARQEIVEQFARFVRAHRDGIEGKAGAFSLPRPFFSTKEHGVSTGDKIRMGVAAMSSPSAAALMAFGADRRPYLVAASSIQFFEGKTAEEVKQLKCVQQTECIDNLRSAWAARGSSREKIDTDLEWDLVYQRELCN
jgi:hypothetical protein